MKRYSWRSYSFLTMSIIVSLAILLLEPTAALSEFVTWFLIVVILLGAFISIILFFIAMFNENEKKGISIFATILTSLYTAVIIFVFWLILAYPWWFFGAVKL